MPVGSLRRVVWSVVLFGCSWITPAWAQDVYRLPGYWVDDRSQPFTLSTLRGRPTVMTMAYGACRRICATSLRVMQQVQQLADQRGLDLRFVVVGLDPQQDTPADWAHLRDERQLQRGTWEFLSGDDTSTRQLARQLGIRYWRYGEHTLHDFRVVLLSDDGRVVRRLDAADQYPGELLP